MENQTCLNCGAPLKGRFCSQCGQKSTTQRITAKHFVQHELVLGVWNMDNKVLFTLKELFTRPGEAARDYLEGKRAQYYNVFYLLLIVLGFKVLVNQLLLESVMGELADIPEKIVPIIEFLNGNAKLLSFALIPFFGLHSWMLFQRLKFSFIEHLIIAGFAVLGYEIILLLLNSFNLLLITFGLDSMMVSLLSGSLGMCATISYTLWVYYSVSKPAYKVLEYGWRMILFYMFCFLEIMLITAVWTYYLLQTGT